MQGVGTPAANKHRKVYQGDVAESVQTIGQWRHKGNLCVSQLAEV